MITITTKSGKKYKPKLTSFLVSQTISQWIKSGILEEVKENKEQYTIRDVGHGYVAFDRDKKDPSILEKLREELERREKEHRDCENELSEFSLGVWQAECEILALLTSLEQPKEETSKSNIPSREELDKMAIPEWTPTPGQMIEVSNDREKWEDRPRKFVCLVGSDHFRAFGPTI